MFNEVLLGDFYDSLKVPVFSVFLVIVIFSGVAFSD